MRLLPALALLLAACDGPTESNPPPTRKVAKVDVTAPGAELRLGKTLQLQAAMLDESDLPITRTVAWTWRGPVSVDSAGVVSATGLGDATITGTSEGVSDSVQVRVVTPVVQNSPVVVGVTHACGINARSETFCWGNNSYGLLGTGINDKTPHFLPEKVLTAVQFSSLSSQGGYTCGLNATGAAFCWGIDIGGSLGTSATQECDGEVGPSRCSNTPVGVAATVPLQSIYAMWTHGCGLASDGRAFCWGTNTRGQLGIGSVVNTHLPSQVALSFRYREITGSRDHTCGLTLPGKAYCWGDNSSGQLGLGGPDLLTRPLPTEVRTTLSFVAISAHGQEQKGHTCGIATDSLTYCWGNNDYGQLGNGTTNTVGSPTPVLTELRFVAIEAGYNWTCGITALGKAHCWGSGARGSIPNTTATCTGHFGTNPCAARPVAIAPEMTFVAVRPGFSSACAVAVDDRAYCWGANDVGKIGNGSTSDAPAPAAVAGEHLFPPRP